MRYTISFCLTKIFALLCAPVLAEVPRVVTDMPPVQSLVAQVMGTLGTPSGLLGPGSSPHSFQLRPSQARAIADADLIVWTGPSMAPWLEHVLDNDSTSASVLALLATQGTHLQPFALSGDADHAHEAGQDRATKDDHLHDQAGIDPHAWLDPDNAILWLGLIADQLAKLDPANAAAYQANAVRAQSDIAALDATLAATLAPAKGKPIVVFHDAYGYFTTHFGLALAGSVSLGDATSPGAARLSALRATLTTGTPACLFPEAQFDPALLTQMAEGTDIRIGGPLDPEGSTLAPGPALYATLLTTLADTIATCLSPP